MHSELLRAYSTIRKSLVRCDWDGVEDTFRDFCGSHEDAIPQWFVDEYVFQAMRLWADGQADQVVRHFASFINKAAGLELVNGIAESEVLRAALNAPDEKPLTRRRPIKKS